MPQFNPRTVNSDETTIYGLGNLQFANPWTAMSSEPGQYKLPSLSVSTKCNSIFQFQRESFL